LVVVVGCSDATPTATDLHLVDAPVALSAMVEDASRGTAFVAPAAVGELSFRDAVPRLSVDGEVLDINPGERVWDVLERAGYAERDWPLVEVVVPDLAVRLWPSSGAAGAIGFFSIR
jgi:hypothetical protein